MAPAIAGVRAICARLENEARRDHQHTQLPIQVVVDSAATSRVIGKGGATIKSLRKLSQASIEFIDTDPHLPVHHAVVRGPVAAVARGLELLLICLAGHFGYNVEEPEIARLVPHQFTMPDEVEAPHAPGVLPRPPRAILSAAAPAPAPALEDGCTVFGIPDDDAQVKAWLQHADPKNRLLPYAEALQLAYDDLEHLAAEADSPERLFEACLCEKPGHRALLHKLVKALAAEFARFEPA